MAGFKFEFRKIKELSAVELTELAELYCQIWREPPWNEEFWTVEEVLKDLRCQMKKPGFQGLAAFRDSELVAFSWSYEVSREMMREICGHSKLDRFFLDCLPRRYEDEARRCAESGRVYTAFTSRVIDRFVSKPTVYYIDECAVASAHRGQGIGSRLVLELIGLIRGRHGRDEQVTFLLRTDVEAGPARRIYEKARFEDTGIRDGNHPTRTYLVRRF